MDQLVKLATAATVAGVEVDRGISSRSRHELNPICDGVEVACQCCMPV